MSELTPLSDTDFILEVIRHLLGDNWYTPDPLSRGQILAVALDEIKQQYKKKL